MNVREVVEAVRVWKSAVSMINNNKKISGTISPKQKGNC